MNTINNTAIVEAKKKIVNTLNDILQTGMPMAIVDLMLELVTNEVKTALQNNLQQESKRMAEEKQIESEQVEWVPEEETE